jgi:hypothetical protein
LNNLTKSKIARAEESDVSNLVHRELTFHSKELEGRKAVDSLKRVLSHGASGSPGALDESFIVLSDLDNAISFAVSSPKSEDLLRLLATAQLMRELRHAILCARWDLDALCDMKSLQGLLHADPGCWTLLKIPHQPSSPNDPRESSLRLSTIISISQDSQSVPGILRKVDEAIAPEAVSEIELIERHLCDAVVTRILKEKLKESPISASDKCEVAPLRESLRICAMIGSTSVEAKSLQVTATILTSMRQAFISNNWNLFRSALEVACRAEEENRVHAEGKTELAYAMDYLRTISH